MDRNRTATSLKLLLFTAILAIAAACGSATPIQDTEPGFENKPEPTKSTAQALQQNWKGICSGSSSFCAAASPNRSQGYAVGDAIVKDTVNTFGSTDGLAANWSISLISQDAIHQQFTIGSNLCFGESAGKAVLVACNPVLYSVSDMLLTWDVLYNWNTGHCLTLQGQPQLLWTACSPSGTINLNQEWDGVGYPTAMETAYTDTTTCAGISVNHFWDLGPQCCVPDEIDATHTPGQCWSEGQLPTVHQNGYLVFYDFNAGNGGRIISHTDYGSYGAVSACLTYEGATNAGFYPCDGQTHQSFHVARCNVADGTDSCIFAVTAPDPFFASNFLNYKTGQYQEPLATSLQSSTNLNVVDIRYGFF